MDNYTGDIDIEVTDVADVNLVYISHLIMVVAWINQAQAMGQYKVFKVPEGTITLPSAMIKEKFGAGLQESIPQTWVTAIEAIDTK